MSISDHQKSYSILGVFEDDDWETVRGAYKRQIHRWHPDRFQDPDQRKIAEGKCKEINLAYQALDDYFQQHGELPPGNISRQHAPSPTEESWPADDDSRSGSGPEHVTGTEQHRGTSGNTRQSTRRGYTSILIVIAAVAGGYMLSEPFLADRPVSPEAGDSGTADTVLSAAGDDTLDADPKTITETDSPAGRTSGPRATWKYGDTAPESGQPDIAGRRLPYITRGSTKQDVLAIQGRPLRATDTAWEYGLSRINFQDGKVTDWYENPMNPLIVQR